ncbi:MAG: type II toxin-antitoxin system Phd/YefM family antitoxin [Magnetococcus sp. DMHC-1]
MTQYTIQAAKTNLSRLIDQSLTGEEILIARNQKPLVKLVPLDLEIDQEVPKGRVFGALKNRGYVDDSFFDPLPDAELAAWE